LVDDINGMLDVDSTFEGAPYPSGGGGAPQVMEPDPLLKNVPPHSREAERALLSSLFVDPKSIDEVAQILSDANQFYDPAHRMIYEIIIELWQRNQPMDVVLVNEELDQKGQLELVGGTGALADLSMVVPSGANAEYYAKIIKDRALQRRLIEITAKVQADAFETSGPVDELLDRAEQQMFEVTQRRLKNEAVKVGAVVEEAYQALVARQEGGETRGLSSYYADLDDLTSGFLPGELTIMAARPSMGKTSFALNVIRNCVMHGHAACFFSLEMPRIQVTSNMLCGLAKIDGHRLRTGALMREEKRAFFNACEILEPLNFYIDDSPTLSTMELRAKGRRLRSQNQIDLIVIDYLQLMTGSSRAARESRQIEVTEISRSTKALARELEIPIICLAQLSRKVEERADKKPMMSDLRESGSIEQDADKILLLHRPEYYDRDNEELKGKAHIIVAKNRNGPTGEVEMHFHKNQMRFESLTRM
jgi:replicative DNA helicase